MTAEQIAGFVRHLLTFAGGFAVSWGYIDEATLTTIIGGIATVVGAVWSWAAKKPA
jgi:hypothetical protein